MQAIRTIYYRQKGEQTMSKFRQFMKENKEVRGNGHYAPTASMKDEKGEPLQWEFRHITSKEDEELREECTRDVPVTGKPNMYRPKINTSQYIMKLIITSTVMPDLYDEELQNSYNVKKPEDLLHAMVDDPGEYQDLTLWIQKFLGFTKSLEERADEAKN